MSQYTLISSIAAEPQSANRVYRVLKPTINYVGFIGYFWQVIRGIYKYPNDKYYILLGEKDSHNVWDFYFEQPHIKTYPLSEEIISTVGAIMEDDSEFVDLYPSMQKMTPEERNARRQKFGSIIKTFFVMNPELKNKFNSFRDEHFKGKKILGYHHRGTDHPDQQDVTKMFPIIDDYLKNYDILFAASDESEVITKIKNYYGKNVILYPSTTRSDPCDFQMPRTQDQTYTHAFRYNSIINWSRENMGYKIGEDAIMETYLLASTDFLLMACNSNVNYFIRAINPNLPYKVHYTPQL